MCACLDIWVAHKGKCESTGGKVMANEFVITERKCEMCECYAPGATTKMVLSNGRVIAKFHLCSGCIQKMLDTYKDAIKDESEEMPKAPEMK